MAKIYPLESLRGLAALSVVLYHFNIGSSFNNLFTQNAWLMVDFFFVLSGFVISLAYAKRLNSPTDIVPFAKKRFLRLYPLHLLVLLCFVGLELVKFAMQEFGVYSPQLAPFTGERSIPSFAANLFLLQNILLENLTWNVPSWSISAEFWVYLIFALFAIVFKNWVRAKALVFFSIVVGLHILLQYEGMGTTNVTGPARCLYSFILGHFTYLIFEKNTTRSLRYSGLITLGSSILLVAFHKLFPDAVIVFIPVVFAMTIYAISRSYEDSLVSKVLTLKPLVFLGTISYGIYMWHMFVLSSIVILSKALYNASAGSTGADGVSMYFGSVVAANIVTLFAVGVTLGLAWLSHRFFETRFYFR